MQCKQCGGRNAVCNGNNNGASFSGTYTISSVCSSSKGRGHVVIGCVVNGITRSATRSIEHDTSETSGSETSYRPTLGNTPGATCPNRTFRRSAPARAPLLTATWRRPRPEKTRLNTRTVCALSSLVGLTTTATRPPTARVAWDALVEGEATWDTWLAYEAMTS